MGDKKTTTQNVFKGNNYRITILTDRLIRFEYNIGGEFLDWPTEFAINRDFPEVTLKFEEDSKYIELEGKYFALLYQKEKPFLGPKYAPDINLKVVLKNTDKVWYFDHPEAKNYKSTAFEINNENPSKTKLINGLFSLDGFASFDDSESLIMMQDKTLFKPKTRRVDTYLFIYKNDFGLCLKDYFTLTGVSPMIPRYALGIWWNRDKIYSFENIKTLIKAFNRYRIPMSTLLLSEFWHLKNIEDYNKFKTGFTFDTGLFPNPTEFVNYMHQRGIRIGINIDPSEGVYPHEQGYEAFAAALNITNKKTIPFNILDPKFMNAYFKFLIEPLKQYGIDYFWIDYKADIVQLRALNYYHDKYMKEDKNIRGLLLTRNALVASHRYPVNYSGETFVNWETLDYLPSYNSRSANIGVTWQSHDVGGYKNGIEDSELYTRHVQLATFSPIFRFSARRGLYYKREPWLWDNNTYNIVREYCTLRHRLIPYIYTEGYHYHKDYLPVIQPLYYSYPEIIDEPNYKNEYFFGKALLIAPITKPKDLVMNRSVERIYLPKGTWYEFKNGKKFLGDKRYVTFFKDEDYPVFARAGAIIPLANLEENLNITNNPKSMEIHIFPGANNEYDLYEDDGISDLYKDGFYTITRINYTYAPANHNVSIKPIEGKNGIIPRERDYIIRFRNCKEAETIDVFSGNVNNKLEYYSYTEDNDFIIEINGVDTTKDLNVNCRGNNIEIEASRIINDDVNYIISDLKIHTRLKEEIAVIFFGNKDIRKKRIEIRKLGSKGLEKRFVKMFLKLLEYISEV